jgi:hypothetical protein
MALEGGGGCLDGDIAPANCSGICDCDALTIDPRCCAKPLPQRRWWASLHGLMAGFICSDREWRTVLRQHQQPFPDAECEALVQMLVTVLGNDATRKTQADDFKMFGAALRCTPHASLIIDTDIMSPITRE